jgi:predicted alpha/beta-hydrolase family hydrolase
VAARWTPPEGDANWTFVYAPGAGSNIEDGFGEFAAEYFGSVGIGCLRFQFPYMEAGKRFPDPLPVLEGTWRSAIALAREHGTRVGVGGRSMGGRAASYVVAQGERVDALVCFAYPLHPPGKPDQTREAHLHLIQVPMLVCSGTRDTFGTMDELRRALIHVEHGGLHILDGADHGYNTLKSSGRSRTDVWEEAAQTTAAWLKGL